MKFALRTRGLDTVDDVLYMRLMFLFPFFQAELLFTMVG